MKWWVLVVAVVAFACGDAQAPEYELVCSDPVEFAFTNAQGDTVSGGVVYQSCKYEAVEDST